MSVLSKVDMDWLWDFSGRQPFWIGNHLGSICCNIFQLHCFILLLSFRNSVSSVVSTNGMMHVFSFFKVTGRSKRKSKQAINIKVKQRYQTTETNRKIREMLNLSHGINAPHSSTSRLKDKKRSK